MDMPVITPIITTRSQAITDIIESVAMDDVTPEVLLATNKSVESMVNAVSRPEMILQSKLSTFDGCMCPAAEPTTQP